MQNIFRRIAATAALITIAWAPPAFAQQLLYRVSNYQLGVTASLDVGNLAGQTNLVGMMLPTSAATGQSWSIIPIGGGQVRLSNNFTGANQCLDVAGDGALYMDGCGQQIGQRWRLDPVVGGMRLTNAFMPGKCLDIFSGPQLTIPLLTPCTNTPNQTWIIALSGTQ